MPIPSRFVDEFMTNPRIKGLNPKGTKIADIAMMKKVISETLSNRTFLQDLANFAIKQGELKLK